MATIRRTTKALFFTTSPRTPMKMRPEIEVLIENLAGQPWNRETQTAYAALLSALPGYEGMAYTDFSARDRINRSPQGLGFVNLQPRIALTDAGREFLTSRRPHEIFTRQLMKFQIPSPYHVENRNDIGRFYVKPFLELLRMIYDLDGLTKDEIAIFFMQLTRVDLYDMVRQKIINFRNSVENLDRSQTSYRRYFAHVSDNEIREIYQETIAESNFHIRESRGLSSLSKFIRTKRSNLFDYADAAIRYMRTTQLVTASARSNRVIIAPDRVEDVEFLLGSVDRNPINFATVSDFKDYLFNARNIELLSDNPEAIITNIHRLNPSIPNQQLISLDVEELKDLLDDLRENRLSLRIEEERQRIETYEEYESIQEVYREILERESIDPPLMLEWNTWRAMVMLDDGQINGNFILDYEGMPLNTAPGNVPDIVCEYSNFDLLVEVTLQSGQRQYESEGEPVSRHLGNHKRESGKEAYCLFIAPNISPGTLAHFFYLHRVNISYYQGTSNIIPMNLADFRELLRSANESNVRPNSEDLRRFLVQLSQLALDCENEQIWFEQISTLARNGLN